MTTVTAFANQKGGVGKSTTVLYLADELARLGRKVLVIDLDQQLSATSTLSAHGEHTIEDVLMTRSTALTEAVVETAWEGVWAVPGSAGMQAFEREGGTAVTRLRKELRDPAFTAFDDVLIDTPPAVGNATVAALIAAHRVIPITEPEPWSVTGLSTFIQVVDDIRDDLNPTLTLDGVLVTKYRKESAEHEFRKGELGEALGKRLLQPFIPLAVGAIDVASSQARPHQATANKSVRRAYAAYSIIAAQLVSAANERTHQ
jgi:chromosome partitioning protein